MHMRKRHTATRHLSSPYKTESSLGKEQCMSVSPSTTQRTPCDGLLVTPTEDTFQSQGLNATRQTRHTDAFTKVTGRMPHSKPMRTTANS